MSEENKNKSDLNDQDWKAKFNDLVQSCQTELKRTTQIGMKMLTASQSNVQLKETYENLGRLVKDCIDSNELNWDNPQAKQMLEKIQTLQSELEELEEDVQNIKKS
ncbi:MAG: hypothetical protein CME67_01500 [Halobacteriovoraceae bacterium]|nr:hypothetical protein [Peredibacter sp.]MBI99877.1 hypothetical protein [Halobacteriovoraceae bacterium]|tara:strand:+ start:334 stop:651 length:318 start_codon:yes stop_codon:yes gene_type:complete